MEAVKFDDIIYFIKMDIRIRSCILKKCFFLDIRSLNVIKVATWFKSCGRTCRLDPPKSVEHTFLIGYRFNIGFALLRASKNTQVLGCFAPTKGKNTLFVQDMIFILH